jgi:hypothetical protein
MKTWERDLIDHLLLMTLLHADRPLTVDEALDELKREFPSLPRDQPDAARTP